VAWPGKPVLVPTFAMLNFGNIKKAASRSFFIAPGCCLPSRGPVAAKPALKFGQFAKIR
jgi:hypothetical protein